MNVPELAIGRPDEPLPADVDVAIIGGGIMGLCIAYHLSKLSPLRIAVIERQYLVAGASGRNGGGVRMQWGDADNVRLMMDSIAMFRGLAQELGINLWFRQGGYLILARDGGSVARLERNVAIHRELGAPTRLLGPHEARDLVPALDITGVEVAAFNPEDGVVFPWALVWGYAAQAARAGVAIRTYTSVQRLEHADDWLLHLDTGERLRAQRVVNATGAWSAEFNARHGFDLPNRPHRHEILSSEPLKPFLDPLVVDLAAGLYCSQSTRGEIVTGVSVTGDADEDDGDSTRSDMNIDMTSSLRFLARLSSNLCRLLPVARGLKVLRQWAGPYDVSPDGDAIVGPTPGAPTLIQVCGFTGHGFMMGPAVGRLVARYIARDERHPLLQRWDPARFTQGARTRAREDMSIG